MRAVWSAVMALALMCFTFIGFIAGLLYNVDAPTDHQLDTDIAEITRQLEDARSTADRYGPNSLMNVQANLRVEILKSTLTMLEQKKISKIRLISTDYRIDGSRPRPPTDDEIKAAERDIELALREYNIAVGKSELYTGGLLKVLHEIEAQTHLVRLALLRQHQIWARLGFTAVGARPTLPALGNPASDKEAL